MAEFKNSSSLSHSCCRCSARKAYGPLSACTCGVKLDAELAGLDEGKEVVVQRVTQGFPPLGMRVSPIYVKNENNRTN